jgi:hypothetical protein
MLSKEWMKEMAAVRLAGVADDVDALELHANEGMNE